MKVLYLFPYPSDSAENNDKQCQCDHARPFAASCTNFAWSKTSSHLPVAWQFVRIRHSPLLPAKEQTPAETLLRAPSCEIYPGSFDNPLHPRSPANCYDSRHRIACLLYTSPSPRD